MSSAGDSWKLQLYQQWAPCIYFAMATLTTVGYGDVSADSPWEQIYATLVMIFGAVVYAIIIGNVTSVIQEFTKDHRELLLRKEIIDHYATHCSMSSALQKRITDTIDYQWQVRGG